MAYAWYLQKPAILLTCLVFFIAAKAYGTKKIISALNLPTRGHNIGWALVALTGVALILIALGLVLFQPSFGKDLALLLAFGLISAVFLSVGAVFAVSARMAARFAYITEIAHAGKAQGLSKRFPRRLAGFFLASVGSLCLFITVREIFRLFVPN